MLSISIKLDIQNIITMISIMVFTYDIFYDRWRSCTISYTFGTLPDRIGAYRYISAMTSCDRLVDHINNMPQYCCVPGCTNSGGHVFPSDPELKKKWRVATRKVRRRLRSCLQPVQSNNFCQIKYYII